jgi:hypothetical protein
VACVEEACKEPVQKIRENASKRKNGQKKKLQLELRKARKNFACGKII